MKKINKKLIGDLDLRDATQDALDRLRIEAIERITALKVRILEKGSDRAAEAERQQIAYELTLINTEQGRRNREAKKLNKIEHMKAQAEAPTRDLKVAAHREFVTLVFDLLGDDQGSALLDEAFDIARAKAQKFERDGKPIRPIRERPSKRK